MRPSACLVLGLAALAIADGADAARFYVTTAGSDANDGRTWATAFATPAAAAQAATAASEACTIRIAEGTYPVTEVFAPPPFSVVIGGFPAGGGDTADPWLRPTVLDAEGRPVRPILFVEQLVLVDGIVTRRGAMGILAFMRESAIRNCVSEDNLGSGISQGASGLIVWNAPTSTSVPLFRVENCLFRRNQYTRGILLDDGPSAVCIVANIDVGRVLRGCIIEDNMGRPRGGLYQGTVLLQTRGATLENVVIRNNSDGALHANSLTLRNVLVEDEGIVSWGSLDASNLTATGGLTADGAMTDSILWGLPPDPSSSLTVTNSIIQGGWPGGTNVMDADPLFVAGPACDAYLSDVAAGQPVTSPAVDAGSVTAVDAGLDLATTRTDGVPDTGPVDLGYHTPGAAPLEPVVVRRGTTPTSLAEVASVDDPLTWNDAPGTWHDPSLRLLFYDASDNLRVLLVSGDAATDAIHLEWQ